MRIDPGAVLKRAFANAHAAVMSAFRETCTSAGWTVTTTPEGYLVRTRGGSQTFCIHGGSTATVAVILDGVRVVVANVGDSTAILCGVEAVDMPLRPASEWEPLSGRTSTDDDVASAAGGGSVGGASSPSSAANARAPCFELTRDHTPESVHEYERVAAFRPSRSSPGSSSGGGTSGGGADSRPVPELLFVYDSLTASKLSCPAVFEADPGGGLPRKTGRGTYYKNVRSEWASLVTTPPHAAFQDALAFTRSLGDLHLQAYGVTHEPDVSWIALPAAVDGPIALVVASDGLWDNWKMQEVSDFTLKGDGFKGFSSGGRAGAQAGVDALMKANLARAASNFGDSADNMTIAVTWMS